MSDPNAPLASFHPLVRRWFQERYGAPTEVQRRAWPAIASGLHVLATAPTGSGKTLAAFLWGIDRLLSGAWEGGRVRLLYVSPLKALNHDVERNLLAPLEELMAIFEAAGEPAAPVRVATRSGDTPQAERRRMTRRPPEILITTPESLNLLLTSDGGRAVLRGVSTVILDEVHAVAASKRGTHLMTAVERLALLAGDFQRIALSATVRPLPRIARWVGGHTLERRGGQAVYQPREVVLLECVGAKDYQVKVDFPAASARTDAADPEPVSSEDERFWPLLVAELTERIRANRATLLFANSRRLAEKVTRFLNEAAGKDFAWSHHGSLAREIRLEVERRFKEGRLPALVATSSLELGIDIGDLDEVLLLQTPPSAASAVQRVGRAGHQVGAVSRGRFYPLHGLDLLEAAVAARAVLEQEVEEISPVTGALDVLAQVLLSMTAVEGWEVDALYDAVRAADPYRELPRHHFDLVLEMLAGRYADSRLPELTPRVMVDRVEGTVRARRSARRLLYLSGGTIPDRGYFHLRLDRSMAKIGELDEEFVWERSVGDRFVLGAQTWRILQITHNDVLVAPAGSGTGAMAPFWRGEERDRAFFLGERVGQLLEWAEGVLGHGKPQALLGALLSRYPLEERAARELARLLDSQRGATGRPLPHRHHLLVERVRDPQDPEAVAPVILHTLWGGRVNRPFALALAAAWEERHGAALEVVHDDHAVMAIPPSEIAAGELLALVAPERLEELLRRRLETTGFFGARFRENAGRALLLPRGDARRRVPLWLNRQRAKKLLQSVSRYRDFPLVLETWRTCFQEEMDLETLRRLLGELEGGEIEVSETVTSTPSPFAGGLSWRLTNRLMYQDDTPEGDGPGLRPDLLEEVAFGAALRPRIPGPLARALAAKLQRTAPGYAPGPEELLFWLVERVSVPEEEWHQLLAAVARDHRVEEADLTALLGDLSDRLVWYSWPGADRPGRWVAALENLPRILSALGRTMADIELHGPEATEVSRMPEIVEGRPPDALEGPGASLDPAALLAEWLRFYGPVSRDLPARVFGLDDQELERALEELVEERRVVVGPILEGGGEVEICDAENLQRLLRMLRAAARPELAALAADQLPLYLALHQGLAERRDGIEGLEAALDRLFGWCAPAEAWEADLLPARVDPYFPSWLDTLMQESELVWVGCGRERLTFALEPDLELVRSDSATATAEPAPEGTAAHGVPTTMTARSLFPPGAGRFTLPDLAAHSGLSSAKLTEALWEAAWGGEATNDAFSAVRRGILSRFRPSELPVPVGEGAGRPRRRVRGEAGRWRGTRAFVGHWRLLEATKGESDGPDPLELEELQRERARILLLRYGVLFRELVAREAPVFQWNALFRTLRLMELSGEILAGHFFEGVPGLQFASPSAYRRLRRGLSQDPMWWLSAIDPASPCGLGLEGLPAGLPRRLSGNHLVFHGPRLVLVSERRGQRLEIWVGPDHPHLGDYLGVLKVLLTRQTAPGRSLEVATINGEPAPESPYAPSLTRRFQVTSGAGTLRLWRRY